MLRLKQTKNTGLALPESTPVTLVQVDTTNLPYACHCPMCGGIFQLPEGLLYKIEEDNFADDVDDTEFVETKGTYTSVEEPGSAETPSVTEDIDVATGGEDNAATL